MPEFEIRAWIDVLAARGALKAFAGQLGFPPRETTELAIVASELGSNIIKYGRHGRLTFTALDALDTRGRGVSVVARDFGPPFHDLAIALQDGCDDRGPLDPMQLLNRKGIGGGLGAVLRMTHSFAMHPLDDGKEIGVTRHLTRAPGAPPGLYPR
jgi:anti-sigma regulatory factor (Ser/Thr protein kinase)